MLYGACGTIVRGIGGPDCPRKNMYKPHISPNSNAYMGQEEESQCEHLENDHVLNKVYLEQRDEA